MISPPMEVPWLIGWAWRGVALGPGCAARNHAG